MKATVAVTMIELSRNCFFGFMVLFLFGFMVSVVLLVEVIFSEAEVDSDAEPE